MIRAYLTDAVFDGKNPRTTALELVGRKDATGVRRGGIIGLTDSQMANLDRARAELRSGDPEQLRNYLSRRMRDKRFDSAVKKAIKTGKPVPAGQTNNMIAKMNATALRLRGETIAQTEGLTAMRSGRHQGLHQLVDTGAVSEEQVKRTWDASGDARVREEHAQMDGVEVTGLQMPFVFPDRTTKMMFPGDKSRNAPASQTIRCRCYERVRISFIGFGE